MCGRFALLSDFQDLSIEFSRFDSLNPPPLLQELPKDTNEDLQCKSYNIPPSRQCPVLSAVDNKIHYMRWGLVPSWSKEPVKFSTFNARIESLDSSRTWKQPKGKHQYCAVPMHGYFEWEKGSKQPYYMQRKDRKLLFMAGLFELSKDNKYYSFTIITSPAPGNMEWMHNRIPIILEPGTASWGNWLRDGKLSNGTFDESIYEHHPVSKKVGSVKIDEPSLIEKIEKSEKTTKLESPLPSAVGELSFKMRAKHKASEQCHDILSMFGKKRKIVKQERPCNNNQVKKEEPASE